MGLEPIPPLSVGHCGIEPHLLTERFYRPLITPVTEASQFAHSTGIEPASPPSTGSVVTIPLRTKLLLTILGKEYFSQYGYELMYQIAVRYKLSSPFLYLVVESNYCHFHVKEIRSHYANEANLILRSHHAVL